MVGIISYFSNVKGRPQSYLRVSGHYGLETTSLVRESFLKRKRTGLLSEITQSPAFTTLIILMRLKMIISCVILKITYFNPS